MHLIKDHILWLRTDDDNDDLSTLRPAPTSTTRDATSGWKGGTQHSAFSTGTATSRPCESHLVHVERKAQDWFAEVQGFLGSI